MFTPMALFAMQQNTPPSCKNCCGNCPGGCCACIKLGVAVVLAVVGIIVWWFLKRK